MKFSGYILCLGVAAAIGCSESEPELPKPSAPAPAPTVEAPVAPVAPTAPAPGANPPPVAAAAGEVEPELKPIQNAIESFQTQNKRMPMNVDELVSSGVLPTLPPPPAGKMYYIDHGTKRIKVAARD